MKGSKMSCTQSNMLTTCGMVFLGILLVFALLKQNGGVENYAMRNSCRRFLNENTNKTGIEGNTEWKRKMYERARLYDSDPIRYKRKMDTNYRFCGKQSPDGTYLSEACPRICNRTRYRL